jgi:hypothetical protein
MSQVDKTIEESHGFVGDTSIKDLVNIWRPSFLNQCIITKQKDKLKIYKELQL